ncbi:MAG TPA: hypothetical protein VFS43_41810 [Polyangiaceae bacterium]|nr:hypothetical protein [Polyangiaceae bacterium]
MEYLTLYAGSAGAGVLWCLLAGPLLRGLVDPSLDEPDDRRLRAAMSATRVPALEAISIGAKCALRAMRPGAAPLHPPCSMRLAKQRAGAPDGRDRDPGPQPARVDPSRSISPGCLPLPHHRLF